MRRAILAFLAVTVLVALAAPAAQAAFGFKQLDVTYTNEDGSPASQAGSHPFAMTTVIDMNSHFDPVREFEIPDDAVRDLLVEQVPGLVGNPTAVPRCDSVDFLTQSTVPGDEPLNSCPNSAAVGVIVAKVGYEDPLLVHAPVHNLVPPPGVAAKIGFRLLGVGVAVELRVSEEPPYNVVASLTKIPQPIQFFGSKLILWGTPADPAHDPYRGTCLEFNNVSTDPEIHSRGNCPVNLPEKPFLTLPRACAGPLDTSFEVNSWQEPGAWVKQLVATHDAAVPPNPLGFTGCTKLDFKPEIKAQPTSTSAESPTGLDFDLEFSDQGLGNPDGIADSDLKKAVVTLPEGVTVNAAQAEGLGVCSEADLARETAASAPGEGCPNASKIGTVEVESPLLEGELLKGSLFVAKPYENPFGSLIAIYVTVKSPKLGLGVKLAGKVEPDPETGQLVTTFEDLPQLPFSRFHLHFREGGRSPLATPPRCGTYTTEARFTPWANPTAPYTTTASFSIGSGPDGAPCPGATSPFVPGFSAGTLSNAAGTHSPFLMRLTRRDGDQDLTRFSATLPPGMTATLAGTANCPEAAIAAIAAKTGREELAFPSCPASSQIGTVLAGAGVGPELTYVPGRAYLAGPYKGAPLSVVGVVPAVAGPFDVGIVATRFALRIDPRSALVRVDGASSDPIPHILAGIPLKVRDIQVSVDRPQFTLNPTSCDPSAAEALLWGGGNDVFSTADDAPVPLAARFQAASCESLGFAPKLRLTLRGGTRRGANPALRGEYIPRPGDANLKGLALRLPRSAFLEQSHIGTICTRPQFASHTCPRAAIYGKARAWTPILDQPLEGPVYMRANGGERELPDFVADLRGLVDVEAVAYIDSKNGGIRATFTDTPDAPLTKVVVSMAGGKKSLISNSVNLCSRTQRANATYLAHNGKRAKGRPAIRVLGCKKSRKGADKAR